MLLSSFQFDKGEYPSPSHHLQYGIKNTSEREVTRKKYVASLENRTEDQIAEEEALYIEIKRLEQSERQFKRDREELLRTLAGIDSGLPDIVEDEGALGLTIDVKKKRKAAAMDIDSPATPSNIISLAPPIVKRPQQTAKTAAFGILTFILKRFLTKLTTLFCYRCSKLYHPYRNTTSHCYGYKTRTSPCLPPFIQTTCTQSIDRA